MSEETPIFAVPTVTKLGPETKGSVIIGGSHAAVFTTYLTVRAGARAAIQHDGAIGLHAAGVSGLVWAEEFGFAMATVAAQSARIGDGDDMLQRGVISRANQFARQLGVVPGMSCIEAAERLRAAPLPHSAPEALQETRTEIELGGRDSVVAVDSVALCVEEDKGRIVATGSHGGAPSFGYASKVGMRIVLFNDAGFGCEYSGISALPLLSDKGIAAVSVSAFTALIGDGRSTVNSGVVSYANDAALELGAEVGESALLFLSRVSGAPERGVA